MPNDLDDLELVQKALADTRLIDLDEIASKTGVPRDTLVKIKYGTTADPRWKTVQALIAWARARAPGVQA